MSTPELILGRMTPDGRAEWVDRSPIPPRLVNRMHVVTKPDDVAQIAGGRAVRPRQPIAVVINGVPTFIMGLGETEAAEIADIVQAQQEKKPRNVDADRERDGLPPLAQAGVSMAEAIKDRIDRHKKNMRTDPPKNVKKDREVWPVTKGWEP